MRKAEMRNQKSEEILPNPSLLKEGWKNLKGKKVLVVGLAKTGVSVARFLKQQGALVTATDISQESKLQGIETLRSAGVVVETGRHNLKDFLEAELIVVSPGVPSDITPLSEAKKKGVEIISEIELASNFIDKPIIAIAGTNGKTTTTTLIGKILEDAGKKVFVGGNIGYPLIDYVAEGRDADYLVVEVSSFQLEGIRRFRPFISLLLNITPDHLDRYAGMDEYAAAKFRLFKNQGAGDFVVLNADDPLIHEKFKLYQGKLQVIPFSTTRVLDRGVYYNDGNIVYSDGRTRESYSTKHILLKGMHNIENIMASFAAAKACAIPGKTMWKTIEKFKGLPHRMELVREIQGVHYYNDSKGTNIGALQKSLEGIDAPVILIAGGKDKGGDYRIVNDIIREKVKLLVLLGEAKEKMRNVFSGLTEITTVASLPDAVDVAHRKAVSGDVVLLSPACSSFDMFKDYKERGEIFRKLVEAIQ